MFLPPALQRFIPGLRQSVLQTMRMEGSEQSPGHDSGTNSATMMTGAGCPRPRTSDQILRRYDACAGVAATFHLQRWDVAVDSDPDACEHH